MAQTQIILSRAITFVIGGPISLQATFTGGESPQTGAPMTEGASIALTQPSEKWNEDDAIAEVRKRYPDADVAWEKSDAEKPIEEIVP